MAAGFILAVVVWQDWSDVGLNRSTDGRGWRLAWLPLLCILLAFGVATMFGLPPASVMLFILINCLNVGFSDELMFHGAIRQAFRPAVPIWLAVILTSVAFGSIHSLNIFVTGELRLP